MATRWPAGAVDPAGTTVGVTLTCTGPSGASCEGQVAVTTKVKHHKKPVVVNGVKGHNKPVVVGRASYTIQAGRVKTIKVSLNSEGVKLLRRQHRLKVKVRIYVSTTSGLRQAVTESVTLKPPRSKK